jgi:ATP-dependent DNA helicase DinG
VPKVPAVPGSAALTDLLGAVHGAFSDSGPLASALDGFEPRDGQRRMAAAVASTIDAGGTLLAEAGTGTGKTLAYLIPAILSRQRVLVSTGTKNLQEQIFFKDLPALERALGIPFTATLMKGRSNYLCRHRWEIYRDGVEGNTSAQGRLIDARDHVLLPVINAWEKQTQTGDRAELRDLPEDVDIWKEIAADAETCLGSECPRYGDCFITLMRQRAAESDVVIVNHHLLCADASVRQGAYGEVIPSCPTLVVDEAHQLEETATQYFGVVFSNYRLDDLVRDAETAARSLEPRHGSNAFHALTAVADHSRAFFAALSTGSPLESRMRYTAETIGVHTEVAGDLANALDELATAFALVNRGGTREPGETTDTNEAAATIERRAGELGSDLRFLLRADDETFVYFGETRGRGVFLRAAPIDVSRVVREALLARFRATVLTSATLAVDESFDYVKGRLGIRESESVRVPSEFDYARQSLLYLPLRMPSPRSPRYAEAVARETVELLRRSRGRAFVLFTSYAMLRTIRPFVEMALPYDILVQGNAPRSVLIEEFRATPNAVLLATSSFWQGVDVVGDALSCVVIDKLPFASPGDPITAARIDAIASRGGNAFEDYQVPLAILGLQQGLGRLIRHRTDRGVLAVLDPRLRTMGYGRRFLGSLPPAPITHDLDAVAKFFE